MIFFLLVCLTYFFSTRQFSVLVLAKCYSKEKLENMHVLRFENYVPYVEYFIFEIGMISISLITFGKMCVSNRTKFHILL